MQRELGTGNQEPGTREQQNQSARCFDAGRRTGDDIGERLLGLAAGVLLMLPQLRRRRGALAVVKQLERCAPAGGANYEEARGAESAADFVHKTRIALKEVRETHYWLRLSMKAGLLDPSESAR